MMMSIAVLIRTIYNKIKFVTFSIDPSGFISNTFHTVLTLEYSNSENNLKTSCRIQNAISMFKFVLVKEGTSITILNIKTNNNI